MEERDATEQSKMLWLRSPLDLDMSLIILIGVLSERIGVRSVGGIILQKKGGEKRWQESKQERLKRLWKI